MCDGTTSVSVVWMEPPVPPPRFKKLARLAAAKNRHTGPKTLVGVRALRASSGGILDPDDRVCDVADDRETLTAECYSSAPQPRAAQADGASGSSAGTASPDMFRGGSAVGGSMRVPNTDSCVEVSAAELEDGANGLQVRRGSEPTLHQDTLPLQMPATDHNKRWSAAIVCRDDTRVTQRVHPLTEDRPPDPPPPPNSHHFQRHSNRLSMQFSGPGSGAWLDAADRVQSYGSKSLPRDARRDPLGQDTNIQANHRVEDMLRWVSGVNNVSGMQPVHERQLDLLPEVPSSERAISGVEVPVSPSSKHQLGDVQTISVTLVKGEKGLGFTITTRDNPTGGHCPIYIKNILPKGAAVTDGRLRAGDRLVSVSGVTVAGRTQQQVVSLLRNTPPNASVEIIVERPMPHRTQRVEPQQSGTKYSEKAIGSPDSIISNQQIEPPKDVVGNGRVSSIVKAINNHGSTNNSMRGRISKSSSKDELVTPDSPQKDTLNSSSNSILSGRNRLILRLDVPVHDSEKAGLGISVKGKVTVGTDPQDLGIFIKSVLHGGAASRDGRLHTNDQLLSVNGVSLVGQSNAEAMETLRRALLHSRPHVHGNISLTIARRTASMDSLARWKDDTPPNGNDTTNSNDNFTNTVIYNNADKENNKINIQMDNNYNQVKPPYSNEKEIRGSKRHASIVTINNNNSWVSNQSDESKGYLERDKEPNKRDSFEWSRLDGWNPVIDRLTGLRNESYYMATQADGPVTNGHREYRNTGHVHIQRSPPPHHNVIIEEDYGTTRNSGSATSAAPCESESDCGEGAFTRDAVGRRSMSEKRHAAMDAKNTDTYHKIKMMKQINHLQVGPSLGMRKSSSLESLQTAIQENQRNPHKEPTYTPLKHWLTDDQGPDGMVRGSPQQSSLSHKKPSIFKSFQSMFRIGKPHKKSENEIYGRSQPGRSSEKSLTRDAVERHSRMEDRHEQKHAQQQRPTVHHSRQSSGERSNKSDERQTSPPYRAPPPNSIAGAKVLDPAWGPSGHYANYKELQHNLNIRREKLSEVQIGQMRQQVNAQRAKAEEESRRVAVGGYHSQRSCREVPPRPQSNYYEYETAPPRRPGKLSHYH